MDKTLGKIIDVLDKYISDSKRPLGIQFLVVFGFIIALVLGVAGPSEFGPLALLLGVLFSALIIIFISTTRNDTKIGHKLRKNQENLANFLVAPCDEPLKIGIFVPREELTHMPLRSGEPTPYQVNVKVDANIAAAFELNKMLHLLYSNSRTIPYLPEVSLINEDDAKGLQKHVLFLVGGPFANPIVENMVKNHSHIGLKVVEDENGEQLHISCEGIEHTFHIHPASGGRTLEDVEKEPTFGCVIKERRGKLTRFAVWGLDERGTRCAAKWLVSTVELLDSDWACLLDQPEFAAIVHVPNGTDVADSPVQLNGIPSVFVPESPSICKICQSKQRLKDDR